MANASFVCVDDYERHAREVLPKQAYDYYRSGADDEVTLRRNRDIFSRLIIRPKFLRDVSKRDLSVSLLSGEVKLPFPVCVAPTASQRMAHPDGEVATAKACEKLGTIMICSTIATTSLEDIAKAAPSVQRWFQLYVYRDREETRKLVKRAENAGFGALVLTVDTPVVGKRRDDMRNGYSLPPHLRMANFNIDSAKSSAMKATKPGTSGFNEYAKTLFDPQLTWADVDWLTRITRLPVVVKGVMTREDALEAAKTGIKGVIVSNHGARQLDSVPATIEALPEVARALKGSGCDVYMDGGVRTGNDVFKALALGAKAVFIGRPVLWGLAHSGQDGVEKIVEMLHDELDLAMALSACEKLGTILICSTIATTSLEDIAKAAPGVQRWFQLYVYRDREETRKLVKRAENAGFGALVLTVDTPVVGKRRDDMRNGYSLPPHLRMANFNIDSAKSSAMKATKPGTSGFNEYAKTLFDPQLTWADVDWLTGITRLPVVVRGVLTREDALEAAKTGIKGVIVSNHGATARLRPCYDRGPSRGGESLEGDGMDG